MQENEMQQEFDQAEAPGSEAQAPDEAVPAGNATAETQPAVRQDEQEQLKKLFTLKYKIPLEEYHEFHVIMSADHVRKNSGRNNKIGIVEVVVGLGLLTAMLAMGKEIGAFYYVLVVGMILMGLYSVSYYRFFYPRILRRVVEKQHAGTPYLQSEITVDFYPNKCTEYIQDKQADTFWHSILEVRENRNLYLIMLGEKRCLLIPKSQLSEKEIAKLDKLLGQVCANYEKKRILI
ncbi:MAG: YcxB family protein [Anaerotruncus rubiinfantis]|jgi:hypothetical protein|uniref:YcxB family protein n=1 Tax=Anaerotruncus rubiinfantis TaxID=1720200 RepID=UPI00189736F5|nr:YcxB family protein [Anaerotruncus rubiinfantis]